MNVLRIALNDIRVVLKDRMILVWWLAMPLAFVFMFSFMVRDQTQDGTWLPVVKLDSVELADVVIAQLRTEKYWFDVKPAADERYVKDWDRALIVPATFSQDILAGKRVDLSLTKGRGSPEKYLAAQTLLFRALIRFNTAIAAVDLIERGCPSNRKPTCSRNLRSHPG